MKHIIAKAGKKELSYDGCFLTFKSENKSVSIRLVEEGRAFGTEGVELYVTEILRLMIAEMKKISRERKHILPHELTGIGIAWGSLKLGACPALMSDILYTLREIGFLQHNKASVLRLEHYTFTYEACTFLQAIPKRRTRARLEVTFS